MHLTDENTLDSQGHQPIAQYVHILCTISVRHFLLGDDHENLYDETMTRISAEKFTNHPYLTPAPLPATCIYDCMVGTR